MSLPTLLLAICLATLPTPYPEGPGCQECLYGETISCVRLVRVHDGDTIVVNIPNTHPVFGEHIGVRLRGIDAPEVNGTRPCEKEKAERARALVYQLLIGAADVRLTHIGRDKYFRLLADVEADGTSVAEALLKAGLAYSYAGKTKHPPDWCKTAPAR